jgi:signal transduction histidine kinase
MKPEDAERIFNPFVRLHGVEDYPGAGLGLSGARKAVDIMGGRIGVDSTPGGGSTFWIELPSGGEA